MEYKEILKFDGIKQNCKACYYGDIVKICAAIDEAFHDNMPCDGRYYANAVQLTGLIEEAEAGKQDWVRDNTLFVCSRPNSCSINDGIHCSPHLCATACTEPCLLNGCAEAVCKPFRGTKGEPQLFNGIDKRVIESLIEECDADAGPTAEDCSEVVDYFDLSKELTGEDRSEVGAPKWDEDGRGCITCSNIQDLMTCPCVRNKSCGYPVYSKYYRIKKDRSDTEYNDKKQEIKEAALKIKEEDGGGVEFVALKNISAHHLSVTDFDPILFKKFYIEWEDTCICREGDDYMYDVDLFVKELLRLGFIERKVDDPVVKLGDTFENNAAIFQASWAGVDHEMSFIVIKIKDKKDALNLGSSCDSFGSTRFEGNLSEIVGKDRISEFTPCNVSIEITE